MEDTLRTTSATSTSTMFATAANTTTLLKSNIETEIGQQEAPRRDQQFFLGDSILDFRAANSSLTKDVI